MKSKKTLLLLLIGAAVILTVIWSTRNSNLTTIKPRILLATTTNSLAIPVKNPEDDKKVSSTFSSKASIVQEQCPLIPNVKADIDTSDLYPNLNFNVSLFVKLNFQLFRFLEIFFESQKIDYSIVILKMTFLSILQVSKKLPNSLFFLTF